MQLVSARADAIAPHALLRPEASGADTSDGPHEVAVFGAHAAPCASLVAACETLGLNPQAGLQAWAMDLIPGRAMPVLALVHGPVVDDALANLAETCRAFGACRVVLVGPGFGTVEAEQALVQGFDEVWPSSMPHQLCVALLQRAWQTAGKLRTSDSANTLQVGPLVVGRSLDECQYHGHTVYLGKDSVALLRVLALHYPLPVSRDALVDAMGKMGCYLVSQSRAVDMAVMRLRQRLRVAHVHEITVATVRGVGYCLEEG